MQVPDISGDELNIHGCGIGHAVLLQGEQDRQAEFVCLEFGSHALLQVVRVAFVAEAVLDLTDVVITAAHQAFDQQLASASATLVPRIRPIGFGFPPTQGGGVGGFAQVARDTHLDMLRHVDSLTGSFGVILVFGAEGEDVFGGKGWENGNEGPSLGCVVRAGQG